MATGTGISFLSNIGTRLRSFFTKLLPIAQKVTAGAIAAEPIVDLVLVGAGHPEAAALYNQVSASAVSAETAAAAAAAQTGTGVQKSAAVLSDPTVQKAFADFEAAVGVQPHTTAQQLEYIDAVVLTLNKLNGAPGVPAQSAPAVTDQGPQVGVVANLSPAPASAGMVTR